MRCDTHVLYVRSVSRHTANLCTEGEILREFFTCLSPSLQNRSDVGQFELREPFAGKAALFDEIHDGRKIRVTE